MKIRLLIALIIFALFQFACNSNSYKNLAQKSDEVDSLVVKAYHSGVTNLDSVREAQNELALKYTDNLDPAKVSEADAVPAAKLYLNAEKFQEAAAVLESFVEKNDDGEASELLFYAYLESKNVADAEKLFTEKLGTQNPQNAPRYLTYIFYSYIDLGDNENALRSADAAIESLSKEQSANIAIEKAEVLVNLERKDEAFELLDELNKDFSSEPRLQERVKAKRNLLNIVGTTAPELTIQKWVDSEPLSIKELRGKVILLDFWAPWCGPCRAMFPHLKNLYSEYSRDELEIIGVTRYYGSFNQLGQRLENLEPTVELEWINKFKEHHDMPIPYAIATEDDGLKNAQAYGVTGIPHMVLIDKKGKVRVYAVGSGPSSEKKLSDGIEKLLAEDA